MLLQFTASVSVKITLNISGLFNFSDCCLLFTLVPECVVEIICSNMLNKWE